MEICMLNTTRIDRKRISQTKVLTSSGQLNCPNRYGKANKDKTIDGEATHYSVIPEM